METFESKSFEKVNFNVKNVQYANNIMNVLKSHGLLMINYN